ncbi:hypothetical protein L249_3495 [Ophiocordyceps polyrhachis-furcata BCC 54312]|uniref:Glycosyltransferase family 69 protein n=1 Tax=Ophiocordyceps polyrhachis-furcata BCC 54312 TaxID=1330021 RepID=A0A367LM92_9HYPO|nr:hypothetical protein L249_3495 [Ophiocordyceps polyrhachis-furcata BCC 54312]
MPLLSGDGRPLRLRRTLRWRTARLLVFFFCLFSLLEVLWVHNKLAMGDQQRSLTGQPHQRIYIASMHFNNGEILRNHWNDAVIRLTEEFGPANVFVSILESGSWDDSKELLRGLARELERRGVPHRVEISDVTHHDEMAKETKGEGWIDTPRNRRELRRITYLAKLRNKTIQDLVDLSEKGTSFDKVLFLNDVVFTTEDVLKLLDTNGGDYGAACSLDFSKPPHYYDTFALRDAEGNGHVMQTWPYLGARLSRNALVNHLDAVPVTSCWNGIGMALAMPTEPFVSSTRLRFRGIPDSLAAYHLEGSECCLIHADNPLSKSLGVYVNPRVRVGYNLAAYEATHRGAAWVSAWGVFRGLWSNRLRRWTEFRLKDVLVNRRVKRWEAETAGNHELGRFCLVNEMQVLADNGWAHV